MEDPGLELKGLASEPKACAVKISGSEREQDPEPMGRNWHCPRPQVTCKSFSVEDMRRGKKIPEALLVRRGTEMWINEFENLSNVL